MDTFCEVQEDVLYFSESEACGIGVIPRGRIGVIAEEDAERDSSRVITVRRDGAVARLWVPNSAITVLGRSNSQGGQPDRLYVGEVTGGDYTVTVFTLDESGEVVGDPYILRSPSRHSHGGVAWGSEGAGAADLSLALLSDCTQALDTDAEARAAMVEANYLSFRTDFIAVQPEGGRWSITGRSLLERLQQTITRSRNTKSLT